MSDSTLTSIVGDSRGDAPSGLIGSNLAHESAHAIGHIAPKSRIVETTPSTGELTWEQNRNIGASLTRLYPQLGDSSVPEGQVLAEVSNAKRDADAAIEAYQAADLPEVASRIAQVAVAMAAAHRQSLFNESCSAVITHVRRGALATPVAELNIGALSALVSTLSSLAGDPMLSLSKASKLIARLRDSGWLVEHPAVALLSQLLNDSDDAEGDQREMFERLGSQGSER